VILVSDSSQNPQIPNSIIDLLVHDIFKKNGISLDQAKQNLSAEQKQMLKNLVSDLSQQVDSFVKNPPTKKVEE
jgi:spore coat protein W